MADPKDDAIDSFRELISGGWIMLFIFGGTLCFMAASSLIAIITLNSKPIAGQDAQVAIAIYNAKIALFKEIIIALMGFLAGAYTTMWNNQHFKNDVKKENGNVKENLSVSVDSVSESDNASATASQG